MTWHGESVGKRVRERERGREYPDCPTFIPTLCHPGYSAIPALNTRGTDIPARKVIQVAKKCYSQFAARTKQILDCKVLDQEEILCCYQEILDFARS